MNKFVIILFVLLVFNGCTIKSKEFSAIHSSFKSENKPCDRLFTKISKQWQQHKIYTTCYYYHKNLISSVLENKDCFMGLSPEDITAIFGSPTRISDKNNIYKDMSYNMSEVCEEYYQTFSPFLLIFKFENEKIKAVKLSVGTTLNE